MFNVFAARCALLLLAASFSAAVHAHGSKADAAPVAVLGLDDSAFWSGGTIATARVPSAEFCDSLGPCPHYALNLAPGGRRLRVGLDTPVRSNTFAIELIDPNGNLVASETNSNQFNSEAFVLDPVPGVWTVRIRPEDVADASYRLRAKLEATLPEDLPASQGRVPQLPNLRTVPPYEFTFVAPANPLNGVYPPDTVNPPLTVLGVSPASCTADEMAPLELGGGAARHCLRFTSGPMNTGVGIYDMRFRLLDDFMAGQAQLQPQEALSRVVVGPMDQIVYYSDGSTETVQAGTYSFHPVHAHFHDDYVLSFELYRVEDPESGHLVRAGEGTKSGFCPADQLFADWRSFNQGYEVPGGDTLFGSCFSPVDGVIGLSVGWGDVYRWQRPGMYVEFAGQPNGRYVVRSLVDANHHVLESNEDDNVSYAYVHIEGDTIQLLERGWGTDPWDPQKTVFAGPGPAQRSADADAEASVGEAHAGSGASGGGAFGVWMLLPLVVAAFRRQRVRRGAA